MVGILLTMIGIHIRAGIGKPAAGWSERLWVHLPFSLYLAWIAVATIANAASLLVYFMIGRLSALLIPCGQQA